MSSAGDDLVERNLRAIRGLIENLGQTLDDALGVVDPGLREAVRRQWELEHDVTLRRVNVVSGPGGRRPWFDSWDPAAGYHWPRLRSWLLTHRGRSEREVEGLDDASDRILAHIEDPRPTGPGHFRVQGLVIGHVQSGKTANFTALIAKAADLGYKLVIVLSGIHNSLREQTQGRLALELGLEDLPEGVGQPEFGERWISLTGSDYHGDFRAGTWNANVLQGRERVIAVVKKNASVLRRLVGWMDGAVPPDLPVLVIDDEADQATINTGGNRADREQLGDAIDLEDDDMDGGYSPEDEISPSVINGLVRGLLSSFNRVSYVSYTATPFANVLIDPWAADREAGRDLYPRDFIVSLPRPPAYVGAERLFGRDALDREDGPVDGLDVVRLVPESELPSLIPGRGAWEATVTDSLRTALIDYILGTAAKLARLGDGISTMLIHTTQRRVAQLELGDEVREDLARIRNAWRYGDVDVRNELRDRWESDHRRLIVSLDAARDMTFEALSAHIDQLLRNPIDVVVLNSLTTEELAYEKQPTRKVVVVGGNRLSRGLTLEELVVSFYVRGTTNYDTLLQMGRWFGYRERYVDLTRLWTTETLYANFRHLALVEEDLRDQIAVYEQTGVTPMEVGPRILAHPLMTVTAPNRMGVAREIHVSYAGQLVQSYRLHLDDAGWLAANLAAVRRFLSGLGRPHESDPRRPDNRPHWRDVGWERVAELLVEFQSHEDANTFATDALRSYITRQAEDHDELTEWWVSVRCRATRDERLGGEDLGVIGHPELACIERTRLKADRHSLGVLTNPARPSGRPRQGDEEVGLSDGEIDAARAALAERRFTKLGAALRAQRAPRQGVLLVYPVSRHSDIGDGETDSDRRQKLFENPDRFGTVVGLAIVFPPSTSAATRTYVGGPLGDPGS